MTVPIGGDGFHLQIRYKGVIDLVKLQTVVRTWMETRGYEFREGAYKLKGGLTHGKVMEVFWFGDRELNNLIKLHMNVYVFGDDLTEITINDNGKKKKLLKGRLYVRLDRALTFDYRGTFEQSKFKKRLEHFLMQFVYKKYLDGVWEDKLRFKLYDLHTEVKKALGMSTQGSAYYNTY